LFRIFPANTFLCIGRAGDLGLSENMRVAADALGRTDFMEALAPDLLVHQVRESYIGDPVEIWTKTCPSNAPAMRTHENCALLHSKCRPTQIPTNKCKQMQTNANKCKQASSTAKVLDSSQSLREFSTATFADSSSNVSDCKTRGVASCSHANSSQTHAACSPCSPSSLECAHFHRLSQYSPGSQNPL